MWLKKLLRKIFRGNINCDKCKSPSYGNQYCEKCQKYFDILKEVRQAEIKVVEENRRKNWIKKRDEFLEGQND